LAWAPWARKAMVLADGSVFALVGEVVWARGRQVTTGVADIQVNAAGSLFVRYSGGRQELARYYPDGRRRPLHNDVLELRVNGAGNAEVTRWQNGAQNFRLVVRTKNEDKEWGRDFRVALTAGGGIRTIVGDYRTSLYDQWVWRWSQLND